MRHWKPCSSFSCFCSSSSSFYVSKVGLPHSALKLAVNPLPHPPQSSPPSAWAIPAMWVCSKVHLCEMGTLHLFLLLLLPPPGGGGEDQERMRRGWKEKEE